MQYTVDTCYTTTDCLSSLNRRQAKGWRHVGKIDIFFSQDNTYIYYKLIYSKPLK